ncbi:MAG: primosomal protein N', partial [Thermoanaerobaculia bacterium]
RHLLGLGRPASSAELRAAGATPGVVAALVTAGFVAVVESERKLDFSTHVGIPGLDVRLQPTPAQARAIAAISAALETAGEQSFLLDGVTGSGKTEVYLAALEKAREAGRQGILLVPEIALAPALVRRVLARFGQRVSLLHSGLSDGERATEWERARRGEVDAVIGPRSAVFAPLPRLGLIVLDEAHETSYKQGESPRYDARDLARARAKEEGLTLVFGSATPAMEQERSAREGRLPRLLLPERPGARARATVEIVDIRSVPAREGDHGRVLFAPRTEAILKDTFVRGEQAILLLNRRGFSPSLLCRACGEDFRCKNCAVARTYHRHHEKLLCHYCGDSIRRPAACPSCASTVLMPIGFGTERLAERFEELFPEITYAVLDRDAASRRGGAARVLSDFESGRAQALLGTQMVAKGHDFPNATALAVLDADALLSFPDFRAAEKTFQLVTQAAGRVGRGERPGLVAVQTSRPEHEAIRAAVKQDHPGFADAELRFRRAFRYPPYTRLLLALFSGTNAPEVESACHAAARAISSSELASRLRLFGPAPAP